MRLIILPIMMTDISSQLLLQTWMSAAFPTGAFSCSHGMEAAISDERISNVSELEDWIAGVIQYGSGWNDAVIITQAYSIVADCAEVFDDDSIRKPLVELNDLALALCAGAERLRETTQLGMTFATATAAYRQGKSSCLLLPHDDIALPVAIGVDGALAGIPLAHLLPASIQASSSNLVWIATRLIPLGQTHALRVISALQPIVVASTARALKSDLDDLGSGTLVADMASIEHEQLPSRICIT